MLRPSGVVVEDVDLGPQPREHLRRHVGRGPVGAVEHQREPGEGAGREHAHQPVDVPEPAVVGGDGAHPVAGRPREAVGGRERSSAGGEQPVDLGLQPGLHLVGQLAAPGGEELDAVVLEGVVGRGDHRRRVAVGGREPGHARRGQHADVGHVGALGHEPGRQGGLQERTRDPGVAADQEAVAGQDPGRGPAQGHDHLGGEVGVGDAANTVGTEPQGQERTCAASAWSTGEPSGPSSGRTSCFPSRGSRG